MKKFLPILLAAAVVATTGCQDDDFPELNAPVDQQFPGKGAIYTPGNADDLSKPAYKIPTTGFTAKSYYTDGQPAGETDDHYSNDVIGRLIDDNITTQWQLLPTVASPAYSPMPTGGYAIVTLTADAVFDYLLLVNRNYANGFPNAFEWYVSLRSAPDTFILQEKVIQTTDGVAPAVPAAYASYNVYVSRLNLKPGDVGNVAKVMIKASFSECRLTNGVVAPFVVRELEFWKKGEVAGMPDYFTDPSCSALKPGTTQAEINATESAFFKNLGQALLDGSYESERIVAAAPKADPAVMQATNKAAYPYSKLQYPTGIWVEKDETLVVLASGVSNSASVTILGKDLSGGAAVQIADLGNGANAIECTCSGTVYVTNADPTQTSLKVNVAGGYLNGYFDASTHTLDNLPFLKSRMLTTANCDLIGQRTLLTVPVSALGACKDPIALLAFYDELVKKQQEFVGATLNTARMHFVLTSACTDNAVGVGCLEFNTTAYAAKMLDPLAMQADILPYAQLMGAVNVPTGFTWNAINNSGGGRYFLGVMTEDLYGLPGYIDQTPGFYYTDAYYRFFVLGRAHSVTTGAGGMQTHPVPLWQLYLYFTKVKGVDFYTNVFTDLRAGTLNTHDNFARVVCERTGYNLTAFFNAWKYALPAAFEDGLTAPVKANVPAVAIEYLSAATLNLYRNPAAATVAASSYTVSPAFLYTFNCSACTNVAAYEVLFDGAAEVYSTQGQFTFQRTAAATTVTANAIDVYGVKHPVTLTAN